MAAAVTVVAAVLRRLSSRPAVVAAAAAVAGVVPNLLRRGPWAMMAVVAGVTVGHGVTILRESQAARAAHAATRSPATTAVAPPPPAARAATSPLVSATGTAARAVASPPATLPAQGAATVHVATSLWTLCVATRAWMGLGLPGQANWQSAWAQRRAEMASAGSASVRQ